MIVTDGLIEQHIHGAFGYDFMTCSVQELLNCADSLAKFGVNAFFPTIMTDDSNIIKQRISIIKQAKSEQKKNTAQIAGIHLEGPFINPQKSGIHPRKYILPLNINIFKEIEDDLIKIITLAPELDTDEKFISYLLKKNIKISAGHTLADNLTKIHQVTHLYNAMGAFSHRENSTTVSALSNENLFVEIIADSIHVSDAVLKITFKQKPLEKILLISDALPLAHSNKTKQKFAGQTIYNQNGKLVNKDGIFAGSSMLLCDIVKNLANKNIIKFEDAITCASSNQLKYHNIQNNIKVYWTKDYNIECIEYIK